MIITQKSFIFNDKLNIPFTYYDRYCKYLRICQRVILFIIRVLHDKMTE